MPDIVGSQKVERLAQAIRHLIVQQTLVAPMTAEDIIGCLAFIAGSAAGQKEAHSAHNTRELRNMAIAYLDAGIQSAAGEKKPALILPN
jgi:hypothetical protein